MTTNNWHVPLDKFSDEQRKVIERVYGVRKCYDYLVNCEGRIFLLTDHHPFSSEITPDEAFAILGLDRLIEPEQGLQDVGWDYAPEGAVEVRQNKQCITWFDNDGRWWDIHCKNWNEAHFPWFTLATRPKPKKQPLTDEQIEAVREFHRSLQFDNGIKGVTAKKLDEWLEEREQTGGEL